MKHLILALSLLLTSPVWAQDAPKGGDGPGPQSVLPAPYEVVENQATFPGGMDKFYRYVSNEFQYPLRCMEEGISGYVMMRFVIEMDGRISNIKVMEQTEACPEFAIEAVRVLKKSPRWKPAMNNGKAVRCYYQLPISLQLE
jgi:protein TonB